MTDQESVSPVDTDRPIPFFTQARTFESRWNEIEKHLSELIDIGKYSHGSKVAEFEEELARWTGAAHVVAVNSGTDALVLLLRACGLRPGDEVIVPAFSFVASASAVALAGGRPVFADIDPVTYALNSAAAEAAITPATTMIMPVHLFCQMADMSGIAAVARRNGLSLVEDSAEAIGMRWDGVHAGLLSQGGVLSFFPTKTLGAIGDAGAVLTDDPEIADTVAALRHHGRIGHTLNNFPGISNPTAFSGMNSKMDDIQACVLLAKLAHLESDIRRRAELADLYHRRLSGMLGVRWLPTLASRPVTTDPVHYVYLVEVDDRDRLVKHLDAYGIGTETYYPLPLHEQPCFADLDYRRGDFPVAEAACAHTLALPFYPDLTDTEVDRVCARIREFFTGRCR